MLHINIDPILAQFGPFMLAWHGIFGALGIYLGIRVPGSLLFAHGVTNSEAYYPAAWWAVAGGLVGARLLFVFEHLPQFIAAPLTAFAMNEGGISVFGGFIGGALVGALAARRRGIPLGAFADAAGAGMALGQAVGRIGDIINGEHHGTPWQGPLAVVYDHPDTLGQRGIPIHLAVGYELVLDLLLFAVLLRLYGRLLRPGMAFWIFFAGYGAIRLIVGFFRQDTIVAWGLGQAQLLGLFALPLAVAALAILAATGHRREPPISW